VEESQANGLPGRLGVTSVSAVASEEPRSAVGTVVVVGGGVSGCACAAALASRGLRVTVVNSALDAVGLPGYGPDVAGHGKGWAEIEETMAALPAVLREVWLDAAAAPDDGAAFLTVDRRMVSVETKRALERIPGLKFRQGLVTDVRMVPEGSGRPESAESPSSEPEGPGRARVIVETVFGEAIEADAVVLAVGFGVGGCVVVGADVMPGGRYGETPADGLREALEALGAMYGGASVEVGARFASSNSEVTDFVEGSRGRWSKRGCHDDPGSADGRDHRRGPVVTSTVPVRAILTGQGEALSKGRQAKLQEARRALGGDPDRSSSIGGRSSNRWPSDYPPCPHWTDGLRIDQLVLGETEQGEMLPVLLPDGLATAEVYLSPEGARQTGLGCASEEDPGREAQAIASRLGHTVSGLTINNLSPTGRLVVDGRAVPLVWVAGRIGGAAGYLDSLRSGIRVAQDVATVLAGGVHRTHDGPCGSQCARVAGGGVGGQRNVPRESR
jgi:hypothetical protein